MRALLLPGGGCRGVFQLGVLRSLLEENPDLDYDIFCGVSVGALNASMLASAPLKESLSNLENIWFTEVTSNKDIWNHHLLYYILIGIIVTAFFITAGIISFLFDGPKWLTFLFGTFAILSLYFPYFSLKKTKSVYKSEPLRSLIDKHLDLEKLKANDKKLRIGAVSYNTGEYRSIDKYNPQLKSWIMASSAFPIFFPMEEIDGELWTDGAVHNDFAILYDAIEAGALEIDLIMASPLKISKENKIGLPNQIFRILDILSNKPLKNDLNVVLKCEKIRIFMPSQTFGLNSLSFKPEIMRKLYQLGRETKAIK